MSGGTAALGFARPRIPRPCGSYAVLSEQLSFEPRDCPGGVARHRTWHLKVGKRFCYVSWLSSNREGLPECLAFGCDEHGRVIDWRALAQSESPDSNVAFAEVIEQLSL